MHLVTGYTDIISGLFSLLIIVFKGVRHSGETGYVLPSRQQVVIKPFGDLEVPSYLDNALKTCTSYFKCFILN
jgi:hypothetical protein